MCVWPSPGCKDASFRIQIHALKKPRASSLKLYLGFAFKTRGKPRPWRTNDQLMFQHDRDKTRSMFASRSFERRCSAIPPDEIKEYCLTVPLAAHQSGLQGSFIATKREITSSSNEQNRRKTIEDGTRVIRDTHYVFARNLFQGMT